MQVGNESELPTAGADPGSRPGAPGELRLVQALVNTLSVELRRDLLGTPDDAARWLVAAGVLPGGAGLSGAEHAALLGLREAIRDVLRAHTDQVDDPAASARLSVALMPCRMRLAVDPADGAHLVSADHDPFSRALGAVAIAIAEAAVAGTWPRLKSCAGHLCGWAFYDRSPSGRSRWCSMQLCGTRSKMRTYRSRQPG